jgi:hypothetical protein
VAWSTGIERARIAQRLIGPGALFGSGVDNPGGRPGTWDVITMDDPLNGTPVPTGVRPVPGRESLLNKISELQTEIGQLQEAIVSHAVIDHAIGVVIGIGGMRSDQGFEVLREVSQHTNIKLRQVCEQIVDWVRTGQLSDEIRAALDQALAAARSSGPHTAEPEPSSPGPTEVTDTRQSVEERDCA